jgi:Twin arginine targeting (Tat) protein translocase TatC
VAVESKEMTFWEHLDELRKVIFRAALVIGAFMVVVFCCKSIVFDHIIFAPRSSDFIIYQWLNTLAHQYDFLSSLEVGPFAIELINIEMSAQFFTHISVSFWMGFVLAFPVVLYQIWLFVRPALYVHEKKAIVWAFCCCSVLFFIGVLVGYFFVFPLTIKFLGTYVVSDLVANTISLQSYISMFTWLILVMGIVFEMPVLMHLLSRVGIVSRKLLRRYRKHAIVILMVLAAAITPSGDAFTMMVVAAPLYLLYEFSILVCKKETPEEDDEDKDVEEGKKEEAVV